MEGKKYTKYRVLLKKKDGLHVWVE
jgi:hypothetical protein